MRGDIAKEFWLRYNVENENRGRMRMIATVFSAGIYGIEGYLVTVECGLVNGLPSFELVGLPGAAVKESK